MAISSIENSQVYHTVIPLFLISLGSLYISTLLFRYMSWRFRRRRAKQARQYRRRLERFWRKHTLMMEIADTDAIQLPTQTYSRKQKHLPQSFDSSATLVVSAMSVQHNSEQDDHHLQEQQTRILKEKCNTLYRCQRQDPHIEHQQSCRDNPSSLKQRITSSVTRDRVRIRQQKKRRKLLWQWSIAMGYCKYHHGHQLDTMINRLLEKQNGSSSSSSSSSRSNN